MYLKNENIHLDFISNLYVFKTLVTLGVDLEAPF